MARESLQMPIAVNCFYHLVTKSGKLQSSLTLPLSCYMTLRQSIVLRLDVALYSYNIYLILFSKLRISLQSVFYSGTNLLTLTCLLIYLFGSEMPQ